ncbi:MAG: ATP-binding cassette domain-containing protein [Evtepia sp.]
MDTVLSLDHVSKVYHNGRGAKNISFSVARGQVVGLLGPNGSGKTTIMKSITGLSQPSEGSITVFGAPSTDREVSLKHVGALIEQPAPKELSHRLGPSCQRPPGFTRRWTRSAWTRC